MPGASPIDDEADLPQMELAVGDGGQRIAQQTAAQLIKWVYCPLPAACCLLDSPRYNRAIGFAREDYFAGLTGDDSLIARDFIFWIRVFR